MNEFEECLKSRRLRPVSVDRSLVDRELHSSIDDMENAQNSFREKRYKWSTIQAYYSMFHAAKALVLNKGYMEKSHYCLGAALRELYEAKGQLGTEQVDSFEDVMHAREEADYGHRYSETIAAEALEIANGFLTATKILLKSDGE